MVGPSSQISKILVGLLFLLILFYIWMDVQLYLRIQNYPIERNYHFINLSSPNTLLENNDLVISNSKQIKGHEENVFSTNKALLTADGRNSIPSSITSMKPSFKEGYPSWTPSLSGIHPDRKSISSVATAALSASSSSSLSSFTDVYDSSNGKNVENVENVKNYGSSSYANDVWISCDINPLCDVTVKAILLDHTNHYLFAPLATIFDNVIGFSRSKFITANMISFFHVFVAIGAARLIASDSLIYRRIGVVLFQFRTFLDDLDGHVARVKKNIRGERSEVGTSGYYIDGLCDGLGCIALMIGITFFLKNNPPRRGYTQLQATLPVTESKNPDCGVIYRVKITTKKVARKVICFTSQLLLSSTAWNRYIALYQDMLERNNVTPLQFMRQNLIFKSNWFFSVAWLWRVFNVHSLLHCVLLSIFCDKLWDFLKMIQYSGFIILLIAICITEMHILEVHNFIFSTLTGNNTSL